MTAFARALHAGVLAFAALAAWPVAAWESGSDGLKPVPPLSARVTDLTQTLTPADTQALEAKLAAFEQQTGGQLVVLIVPSTQPEPIESYAIRVAEAWKIGRKGQDNGVLFVVAKDDRKMRLEVGYGYEGVLPDVTARRIIAEDVAPKFRDGRFADGINAGVERVIGIVSKGETLPQKPAKKASGWRDFDPGMFFILLFVVIPVVGAVLKRIFGKLLGSAVGAGVVSTAAWFVAGSLIIAGIAGVVALLVMLFAGGAAGLARGGGGWIPPTGGSGGGFGGGFGGGGGGGFSGGGGSFGGGGASGDW